MRRKFLKWILSIVLLPGSLNAQDTVFANLPAQWRLEDCISYATLNNITLASLRLSTRSAEEDYMQSKAAVNPDLYASASASQLFADCSTHCHGRYLYINKWH